ncbi:hypothetical protein DX933_05520 [Ornithinibacillus gellani]|uniref:hypothetical protein n=1 Tax=Ornithinibacillus gellani TaxID=2293253 RepID=UPI000F47556D|nr:hypothetical protein [Ornithinibacillus gellani]TQS75733.1 hypothetical protein DX933_05520 [Ornithinibacillus gellani]
MFWIIAVIIVVIVAIILISLNKGKSQSLEPDDLTPEEKDLLEEDYLTHGTRKKDEDPENI